MWYPEERNVWVDEGHWQTQTRSEQVTTARWVDDSYDYQIATDVYEEGTRLVATTETRRVNDGYWDIQYVPEETTTYVWIDGYDTVESNPVWGTATRMEQRVGTRYVANGYYKTVVKQVQVTEQVWVPVEPTPQDFSEFLEGLYARYLGRSSDADGLAWWNTAMQNGTTAAQAEAMFAESPEAAEYTARLNASVNPVDPTPQDFSEFLEGLYVRYLGRPADADGLAWWNAAMLNGTTAEQAEAIFATCDEAIGYQTRLASAEDAVKHLFSVYLQRPPTPSELAPWVQEIMSGADLAEVDERLFNSPAAREARDGHNRTWIAHLFVTYLRRPGTAAEISQYADQLRQGTANYGEVMDAILLSPEAIRVLTGKPYVTGEDEDGYVPDANDPSFGDILRALEQQLTDAAYDVDQAQTKLNDWNEIVERNREARGALLQSPTEAATERMTTADLARQLTIAEDKLNALAQQYQALTGDDPLAQPATPSPPSSGNSGSELTDAQLSAIAAGHGPLTPEKAEELFPSTGEAPDVDKLGMGMFLIPATGKVWIPGSYDAYESLTKYFTNDLFKSGYVPLATVQSWQASLSDAARTAIDLVYGGGAGLVNGTADAAVQTYKGWVFIANGAGELVGMPQADLDEAIAELRDVDGIVIDYETGAQTIAGSVGEFFSPDPTAVLGKALKLAVGVGNIADALRLANRSQIPDGINFRVNLPQHLSGPDGFSQRYGINGTHNQQKFMQAVTDHNAKIVSTTVGSNGITHYMYQIPARNPDGTYKVDSTGSLLFKEETFQKTVYDSAVHSDQKMLDLGMQAAINGYDSARSANLINYESTVEGITFSVMLDAQTGRVTTVYPKMK